MVIAPIDPYTDFGLQTYPVHNQGCGSGPGSGRIRIKNAENYGYFDTDEKTL
jgi:hypothetical protein